MRHLLVSPTIHVTADSLGTVSAYNANKGLILFINFPTARQSLVLRPKFRGLRLQAAVPQPACRPPCQPPLESRERRVQQLRRVLGRVP